MLKILEYDLSKAYNGPQRKIVCEILADTEADITGMGDTIEDAGQVYKPLPGSMACTADGAACYVLSPSNVWTKVVN